MGYRFSVEKFKENFNAKDITDTIYKPYHLPFNPLALTKSSVFKPLLPMHTANAFKDTLSKAFNLGPKQQNTLLQCILETYRASGIMPANPDTWDEPAPTLSELALFQTNNLVEGVLKNVVSEARVILERKIKISEQISDLQSYLTLDINENELEDIQNKIRTMENQIIDDKIKIADLEQRYSEAVSKMNSATSELNKQVETYLSIAELKDKADRTKRYSNIALKIIERYEIELQKRKIDVLAETITNCYTKLANKKNLIKTIVMDPETLDLKYLSEEGIEIPKDSLSAGEQQLMVISILWALAICSKKKLPVIIDTPLSRLDSLHRTALITTYFPNAGEQTIILSTDSEIDENYYELMRENVGDEFTLKYDEDSKSTSIERGYLIGAKL